MRTCRLWYRLGKNDFSYYHKSLAPPTCEPFLIFSLWTLRIFFIYHNLFSLFNLLLRRNVISSSTKSQLFHHTLISCVEDRVKIMILSFTLYNNAWYNDPPYHAIGMWIKCKIKGEIEFKNAFLHSTWTLAKRRFVILYCIAYCIFHYDTYILEFRW